MSRRFDRLVFLGVGGIGSAFGRPSLRRSAACVTSCWVYQPTLDDLVFLLMVLFRLGILLFTSSICNRYRPPRHLARVTNFRLSSVRSMSSNCISRSVKHAVTSEGCSGAMLITGWTRCAPFAVPSVFAIAQQFKFAPFRVSGHYHSHLFNINSRQGHQLRCMV